MEAGWWGHLAEGKDRHIYEEKKIHSGSVRYFTHKMSKEKYYMVMENEKRQNYDTSKRKQDG